MRSRWLNRRVIVKAGLFLLLGAIINVAVAWGPAVWFGLLSGYGIYSSAPTSEEIRWWNAVVSPGADDIPTEVDRPDMFPIGFDCAEMRSNGKAGEVLAYRWRSGLPLRSMGYYSWTVNPKTFDASEWHTSWSLAFDVHRSGGWTTVVLPLTPLWPGFVVDTLLFAALAALILGGWRWMGRRWRLMCSRCPACNYPIGASPVCTECGAPLPSRADS